MSTQTGTLTTMQTILPTDCCGVCMDESSRDFLYKTCCTFLVCRKCYNLLEVEAFPNVSNCPGCRSTFTKVSYTVNESSEHRYPQAYCGERMSLDVKEHQLHFQNCLTCLQKIVVGNNWFEKQITKKFIALKQKYDECRDDLFAHQESTQELVSHNHFLRREMAKLMALVDSRDAAAALTMFSASNPAALGRVGDAVRGAGPSRSRAVLRPVERHQPVHSVVNQLRTELDEINAINDVNQAAGRGSTPSSNVTANTSPGPSPSESESFSSLHLESKSNTETEDLSSESEDVQVVPETPPTQTSQSTQPPRRLRYSTRALTRSALRSNSHLTSERPIQERQRLRSRSPPSPSPPILRRSARLIR